MCLLNERKAISVAERARQSRLLCEQLQQWLTHSRKESTPLTIAAFWPLAEEPDITPVLHQLIALNQVVVLPVVATRHAPLEFHRWIPDAPMTAGNFGVMEPARTQALQPDILFVPTLGYTSRGDRLGYGGGYYDRTLAAMHQLGAHPLTIGIAWSEGLLTHQYPDYLPQGHDMPLNAVLNAQGWLPAQPDFPG